MDVPTRINGISLGKIIGVGREFSKTPVGGSGASQPGDKETITAGGKKVDSSIATKSVGYWLFFGKEVHHPGIPPRPVLPTKDEAEKLVVQTVDGMLGEAVK